MKLSFHGGTREVTGACYLIETSHTKVLVDCGLFQGPKEYTDLNFENFHFNPNEVSLLLITHAHLDHIGRIPKLVREGFRGKIFSTAATRDLARLLLEDALSLAEHQEKQFYSEADLQKAFELWQVVPYEVEQKAGDIAFQFDNAGHILGSSFIEVWAEGKHLLFSGDIGNAPSLLIPRAAIVRGAEYLIVESTYGSKTHESTEDRVLKLERAVEDTASRGGTLLIPAFAMERTQDILHLLNEMLHFKRIPDIPVFVDSPLAIRITQVFEKYSSEYREEIKALMGRHPNLFRFKRLRFTPSVDESKRINDTPSPKVIIAGSGMMTGGRILHHARRYLPDAKSMLLIIGYQTAGSLGRRVLDGEKQVKIFGELVFVEAEIRKIEGFSAHADSPQLLAFVEGMRDTLKHVFVVHGEEPKAMHFTQEIRDHFGISADAPMFYQEFTL